MVRAQQRGASRGVVARSPAACGGFALDQGRALQLVAWLHGKGRGNQYWKIASLQETVDLEVKTQLLDYTVIQLLLRCELAISRTECKHQFTLQWNFLS